MINYYRKKPKQVYSHSALNFKSTSTYLQYQGSDTSDWDSIQNIAPASSAYTPATFSLDLVNDRILVDTIGYSCGFIIKNSSGDVVVECPAVEGEGDGYNDIVHNIYSKASEGYADHFRITNATLSLVWIDDVLRSENPYLNG